MYDMHIHSSRKWTLRSRPDQQGTILSVPILEAVKLFYAFFNNETIASPTSEVPDEPPRSEVRMPESSASLTACSIRCASASMSNEYRNIIATQRIMATGFAMFFPAILKTIQHIHIYAWNFFPPVYRGKMKELTSVLTHVSVHTAHTACSSRSYHQVTHSSWH